VWQDVVKAFLLLCALLFVNCIPHAIFAIAYERKKEHSSNLSKDKKLLWKSHVHKSEDNTKSELGEMSCEHVDWIQMTQDMVLDSKETGNFLNSLATFSFPRRNMLHTLCYMVITHSYMCSGDTLIRRKKGTDAMVV
jgi:hypothetical protein